MSQDVPADAGSSMRYVAVFVAAIRKSRYLGLYRVDSGTVGEYEVQRTLERSGCD